MNIMNISGSPINQLCAINSPSLGALSAEIIPVDLEQQKLLLGDNNQPPEIYMLAMSYLTPYEIVTRLSEEITHNEKVMAPLCSQYWPQKPRDQEDNAHAHFALQCAFAVAPIAHSLLSGHHTPTCGMTTLNNNHIAFGSPLTTTPSKPPRTNTVNLLNMHNRQMRILHQHAMAINDVVAFENLIASTSSDRTVRVSDLSGRTLVLQGHTDFTTALSFLDKNNLVSGSWDQTLKVWDLKEGTLLHTLKGHRSSITAVAFADRNTIFSASDDKVLRIWNVSEGTERKVLEGHQVKNLAVCSGRVVSDSQDFTLKIWNLVGEVTHVLRGHSKRITGLAFLDQHTLASTSMDGTLRVWDAWEGRLIRVLTEAPRTPIVSLGMLTSGQIVCGSRLDGIKMWDPQPFFITLKNIKQWLPARGLSQLVTDYLFTSILTA